MKKSKLIKLKIISSIVYLLIIGLTYLYLIDIPIAENIIDFIAISVLAILMTICLIIILYRRKY